MKMNANLFKQHQKTNKQTKTKNKTKQKPAL